MRSIFNFWKSNLQNILHIEYKKKKKKKKKNKREQKNIKE